MNVLTILGNGSIYLAAIYLSVDCHPHCWKIIESDAAKEHVFASIHFVRLPQTSERRLL